MTLSLKSDVAGRGSWMWGKQTKELVSCCSVELSWRLRVSIHSRAAITHGSYNGFAKKIACFFVVAACYSIQVSSAEEWSA